MRKNLYEAFGETKSIYEWVDDPRCVVPFSTLKGRVYNNPDKWSSFEDAITAPLYTGRGSSTKSIKRRRSHKFDELNDPRWIANKTIRQVMKDVGCSGNAAARAFRRFNLKPAKATTQGHHQNKMVEGKTAKEWRLLYQSDVSERLFWVRLRQGWSIEDALLLPPREYNLLEAFGEHKTLSDWLRDERCVGTTHSVRTHLKNGASLEEALLTPAQKPVPQEAFGECKTYAEWSRDPRCVVGKSTLHFRVSQSGWDIETALTTPISQPYSHAEGRLAAYVSDLGLEVQRNVRSIISPMELDILVPERGLAIEFNGIYWHSERRVGQYYHRIKYEKCKSAGIQLIQVWEDDWRDSPEIIMSMLAHKLGKSTLPIIGASKCNIVDLSSSVARKFLDTYHIQGYANAGIRMGLATRDGDLVAVITFRASNDVDWELVRYATSARVPGGFNKLLRAFRRRHPGSIKTFADLTVSNGAVYEQAGFILDKVLRPDYKYVVSGQRVHKFNYRIQRFRSDPDLLFEEGLTETQLAELNGLERIYDAGKARYILP